MNILHPSILSAPPATLFTSPSTIALQEVPSSDQEYITPAPDRDGLISCPPPDNASDEPMSNLSVIYKHE